MSKQRSNKRYSFELKLEAVQKVLDGESVLKIAKRFDVMIQITYINGLKNIKLMVK